LQDATRVIKSLEAEFSRHANNKDANALTESFYAEDAQLLPPNAPLVRGKAAIRAFWTAFLAAGATDCALETQDVGMSGDLAYNTGRWTANMGGQKAQGKYAVVYRRQSDGGFKAIVDAFNADA
jgi:ketosteroid isomerase-like protein